MSRGSCSIPNSLTGIRQDLFFGNCHSMTHFGRNVVDQAVVIGSRPMVRAVGHTLECVCIDLHRRFEKSVTMVSRCAASIGQISF